MGGHIDARGKCSECRWLIGSSAWCGPVCDAPIPAWATVKSQDERIISLDSLNVTRRCEAFQKEDSDA